MDIKVKTADVVKLFKQLGQLPSKVHSDAYFVLKKKTPKKTGNARSKTRKESNLRIGSRYPYAERLDTGWSKQAPGGFTDPTIDEMEKIVAREVRKID